MLVYKSLLYYILLIIFGIFVHFIEPHLRGVSSAVSGSATYINTMYDHTH